MNTEILKNKIADIEEFCKLYKINIPIEQKFEYYKCLNDQIVDFMLYIKKNIRIFLKIRISRLTKYDNYTFQTQSKVSAS